MLAKHPHLRNRARGYHGDGPQPWLKRLWHHRCRQIVRQLLRLDDQDGVVYPEREGSVYEWY